MASTDPIRPKAGILPPSKHSRKHKSRSDDAPPHRRPGQRSRLDVGGEAAAAIETPARRSAKCRRTGTARRHRFVRRWLAWLNWLLVFIFVVAHVIVIKRTAGVVALQGTAIRRVVARGRQRQPGAVRQ